MADDDDALIDEFLDKLNLEEYEAIKSAKEISSNFTTLNDVLEPMNETKIKFENPELKIDKKIRNRVLAVIPINATNNEDNNFLKDIKVYQSIYEMDAKKVNDLIEGIKDNFYILSGSVKNLINAVEKSKTEYFQTIKLMMSPMTAQVENLNKIDVSKFNKEKQINYEDKRKNIDDKILEYDGSLQKILAEKKDIIENVNQNLLKYINLMNQLDGPINSMIDEIENILNIFEEKSKNFINIIMNYTNPNEKKLAMKTFNEIQQLNNKIVALINDYSAKLIENKNNIEKQIKECNRDIENIRQNNMTSSEKMSELQEDTKEIIKEINELFKFCWVKTKIPQITKELKGFQLYDIKSKMDEGTKNVIKANEKLEVNLNELKKFVKEKGEILNQFFSLDLVFIMDITGSMERFIDFTKEKIISIINSITEETTVQVRLGFIGYRDYLDGKEWEYYKYPELTNDVGAFKRAVESIRVGGGGNCEDMVGGLVNALEYDWNSNTKFALLIADTPCHGIQYHEVPGFDSHEEGDSRYKIDEIVKQYAAKNINFLCLNIEPKTKKLYENFIKYYNRGKKANSTANIEVQDFTDSELLAAKIVSRSKELYSKRYENNAPLKN